MYESGTKKGIENNFNGKRSGFKLLTANRFGRFGIIVAEIAVYMKSSSTGGNKMRVEQQLTKDNGRNATFVGKDQNNYSKFVDRVNAQRFKAMVGASRSDRTHRPKLGVPFALERSEAAAAHRELEEELKPAARDEKLQSGFSTPAVVHEISSGASLSQFGLAVLGVCSLICAYAVTRSLK